MIEGVRRYAQMKDSDVPWLREIPSHWSIIPAFACYRPKEVKNVGMVEKTVLSLSYGRIIVKPTEKLHGLVPESFETYQIVEPGNIIVRTTDLQNDRTSLRVGYARQRGIITSAYMCLETKSIVLSEFGYQFLNAFDLLKGIYGYGSGLRQNLNFGHIKRMPVAVPPKDEQSAILQFVHHVDLRISQYIRAKQKLIKLLDEQVASKAAELMRLPNCKVERIGTVAAQLFRPVPRSGKDCYTALGLYNRGRGIFHKAPTLGNELGDSEFFWVSPGDLVISGQFAWEGAVAIASANEEKTVVSHRYHVLRGIDGRATTAYLFAMLRSDFGGMLLDQHSRGAAGRNRPLNIGKLLKEPVPIPSFEEQLALSSFVDSLAPIRACITSDIALVREYRSRLVSDVVTGKLDVREASSRLPEYVSQVEALDETEELQEDEEAADNAELEAEQAA